MAVIEVIIMEHRVKTCWERIDQNGEARYIENGTQFKTSRI